MKKLVMTALLISISINTQAISWSDFWSGVDAFLQGYSTAPGTIGGALGNRKLKTSNGRYAQKSIVTDAFYASMAQQLCKIDCSSTTSPQCTTCKATLKKQVEAFLRDKTNYNACISVCKTYQDIATKSTCLDICNRE